MTGVIFILSTLGFCVGCAVFAWISGLYGIANRIEEQNRMLINILEELRKKE